MGEEINLITFKKESKEELEKLGHKKENLIKLIRKYCDNCCGDCTWKACGFTTCELYPYRDGHNPFIKSNISEELRKANSERFKKMWADKKAGVK